MASITTRQCKAVKENALRGCVFFFKVESSREEEWLCSKLYFQINPEQGCPCLSMLLSNKISPGSKANIFSETDKHVSACSILEYCLNNKIIFSYFPLGKLLAIGP